MYRYRYSSMMENVRKTGCSNSERDEKMDIRIRQLIESVKEKYHLGNYHLKRHHFYDEVTALNKTSYILCMEWFPTQVEADEDEELNPEGTAVIEVDVKTGETKRVIFVGGKSYADQPILRDFGTESVIRWIEQETGLSYWKQFSLSDETERKMIFKACIEGVDCHPAGILEVQFDASGSLTLYSRTGLFPSKLITHNETLQVTIEECGKIIMSQLKRKDIPIFPEEKLLPVLYFDKVFIQNRGRTIIGEDFWEDNRPGFHLGEVLRWESPCTEPFRKVDLEWIMEVSAEQALADRQSTDHLPPGKEELDTCRASVMEFMRQEYPDESGIWVLDEIYREKGYIFAILKKEGVSFNAFERKLKVIIDPKLEKAVQYFDNKWMAEQYKSFPLAGTPYISEPEALEKIKGLFELKPAYLYDFNEGEYVYGGILDCSYGVNAATGELVHLGDL